MEVKVWKGKYLPDKAYILATESSVPKQFGT